MIRSQHFKKAMIFCAGITASLWLQAQTFWTEDFGTGCNQGSLANSYSGTNGSWTISSTGTNDPESNKWFISATEAGTGAGNCGDGCLNNANLTNQTLHIGPDDGVTPIDASASYNAGGFCGVLFCVETNTRAESPTIDCSGQSNISIEFLYMEKGDGSFDDGTLWYFDGNTWALLDALAKTPTINCDPAGEWTSFSTSLPSSADNNPNVKIGFEWTNNDDFVGADPSFAVDDIELISTGPPLPNVAWSSSDSTICEGECIEFQDLTANSPFDWHWTFEGATPDTSGDQNPTNICYDTAGTYAVTLVATNAGGTDSLTIAGFITVIPCPKPEVSFTASDTMICQGECIDFTDMSTESPIQWNWSFPGATPQGSSDQHPDNVCYDIPGTYDVTLTATNQHGGKNLTKVDYITVVALPVADFSADQTSVFTANGTVAFTDLSTGATSWSWDFGDGGTDTGQNPKHTYTSPGNFSVTLIVTNSLGCADTVVKEDLITVESGGVGISSVSADNLLEIYPNPLQGNTTLKIADHLGGPLSLNLYNGMGKLIRVIQPMQNHTVILDKGDLNPGIYILQLHGDDGIIAQRKLLVD